MMNSKLINIPNILSFYRLTAIPFIVRAIFMLDKDLFILLLSINLITDILDGWIARRFKMETEFGARLDSLADIGTIVMAVMGMAFLEPGFMTEHAIAFGLIVGLYVLFEIISLIRFKKFPSLHLYSSKVVGYIQGIFIFTYFMFGYTPWYFYFMVTASCLSYLEELIIILWIPELRSNCKGLYWMLKQNKKIA